MSDELLDRLAALRRLLAGGALLTADDLAGSLGVTPRTVQRDVGRLRRLGLDVEAVRGRAGGFRLRTDTRRPGAPLLLTAGQAGAVVLALRSTSTGSGSSSRRAADTILARLPAEVADDVEALRRSVLESPDPEGTDHGHRHGRAVDRADRLVDLATAVRDRRQLGLRYRAWSGDRTERTVDPHGLVRHGGRWYLAVHDHLRDEPRTLRVDRIEAHLVAGPVTSRVPPPAEVHARVRRRLDHDAWTHDVRVVLATDLDRARRLVGDRGTLTSAIIPADRPGAGPGRGRDPKVPATEWAIGVEDLPGMARVLAWLGVPFHVVQPAALRSEVHHLADRLRTYA